MLTQPIAISQAPPGSFGNADEVETIPDQGFGLVINGEETVA
jgi:hypothetical protein